MRVETYSDHSLITFTLTLPTMILGFKTHWPDGRPTHFKEKILATTRPEYFHDYLPKIHTVRASPRWQPGQIIHMATGVRTKHYQQFNQEEIIRGCTYNTNVRAVQPIRMAILAGLLSIQIGGENAPYLNRAQQETFAHNDGFNDLQELCYWFFPNKKNTQFSGFIIHFTDFVYPEK